MFNITIYKLFNNDLQKLDNHKLVIHWKVIGHKENRIHSIESFFKKYSDFNIETYKKNSFDLQDKDDIYIMRHYHINRNAYFNENKNNSKIIKDNITDTNNNYDKCKINNLVETSNIIQTSNIIEISNIIETSNIIENKIDNIKYIQEIYDQIFIKYNEPLIFNLFIINKNINISELLNYIYSKSIKIKIKNIYILSVENIIIYNQLYNNLIIVDTKYINNDVINYYLKKIKKIKKDNFIIITKFNFSENNIFEKICNDLQYYDIKYIYYEDFGIHYLSDTSYINNYYFDEKIKFFINGYYNENKYAIYNSNIFKIYNDKIYNLLNKPYNKRMNNHYLNILINFDINNFKSYLSFFFFLNFCEKNNINLFLKNNTNSFFKNFSNIYFNADYKIINDIYTFNNVLCNTKITLNNESNLNVSKNLIISSIIYNDLIDYNIVNNNYINIDKISTYYEKLNFLDLKRKIIGIYIDKNNYEEVYIINCLSKIDFENSYIILFCEDNNFLNNLDLLNELSYLNSNEIQNNLFSNKEDLLSFMSVCDYLILNYDLLSIILSYLNNNKTIFLPYYDTYNQYTNQDDDIIFCLQKYNYQNIEFIHANIDKYIFNNKIISIFETKYIIKNNNIIKINENKNNEINENKNKNKNNEINEIYLCNDIIYSNFYFIHKINPNIKLVSIYNFNNEYVYNYKDNDCCLVENNNNIYIKIFDKIKLVELQEEKIINFYKKTHTINISKLNVNHLYLVEEKNLYFKLFIVIQIPNIYYLSFIKNKILKIDKNFKYQYLIIINNDNYYNNGTNNDTNNDINQEIKNIRLFDNKKNISLENILINYINFIDNEALLVIFENIYFYQYNLIDLQILFLIKNEIILKNNDYKIYLKKNIFIDNNNIDNNIYNNIYNFEYFINYNYYFDVKKESSNLSNTIIFKYLIYLYESHKKYKIDKIKIKYENIVNNDLENFGNDINLEIIKKSRLLNETHKIMFLYYLKNIDLLNYNIVKILIKEVINIDSRGDKLEYIYGELNKKSIYNYQIFKGVVPLKEAILNCPYINIACFMNKISNKYIIGSSGCKMSHMNLLQKYDTILNSNSSHTLNNCEYMMIIEDDACFDINYDIYLEFALKSIDDFDILYLSVNLDKKEDALKINPFLLKILHGKTTTSYIVKLKNIHKIINVIQNSKKELDDVYSDSNLNKYCVYPMIVHQKNFKSDISYVENGYGNYHEKYEY